MSIGELKLNFLFDEIDDSNLTYTLSPKEFCYKIQWIFSQKLREMFYNHNRVFILS